MGKARNSKTTGVGTRVQEGETGERGQWVTGGSRQWARYSVGTRPICHSSLFILGSFQWCFGPMIVQVVSRVRPRKDVLGTCTIRFFIVLTCNVVVSHCARTGVAFILSRFVNFNVISRPNRFRWGANNIVYRVCRSGETINYLFPIVFFRSRYFFMRDGTAFRVDCVSVRIIGSAFCFRYFWIYFLSWGETCGICAANCASSL